MGASRFFARLFVYLAKHYVLACVLAAVAFIAVMVGLLEYTDVLVYSFLPNDAVNVASKGLHQPFLQSLVQYDSGHYLRIAQNGYQQLPDAAFLPLFPLSVLYVERIIASYGWAGLVAAWLALGAAVVVLYKWVEFELRERGIRMTPWLTLGLLAIFPTAFYLAIPYTESLFLLVNVSALYAYRRGNYGLAAVCAALASLTKYQGAVLAVFFAADYWFSQKRDWQKLLPVAGALSGLGVYMTFLHANYGSFFEFLRAQKEWGRLHGSPLKNFAESFRVEYLWFLPVLAAGLRAVYKYLGKAYFWYTLAFVLLPLSSGRLDGLSRYMLSAVPLFLGLAIAYHNSRNGLLKTAYTGGSLFVAAWLIMLFANGYIVQ